MSDLFLRRWFRCFMLALAVLVSFATITSGELITPDASFPPPLNLPGQAYEQNPDGIVHYQGTVNYGFFKIPVSAIMTNTRLDNLYNIVSSDDGTDELLDFDGFITTDVTELTVSGVEQGLAGQTLATSFHMQLRLLNKNIQSTANYNVVVENFTVDFEDGDYRIHIRKQTGAISDGTVKISDLGGAYAIESVLNLYTEASATASGITTPYFADQEAPLHLTLVPEPATLSFLLAGAGLLRRRSSR